MHFLRIIINKQISEMSKSLWVVNDKFETSEYQYTRIIETFCYCVVPYNFKRFLYDITIL